MNYIFENNIDLYQYFPPDYFNSSHSPQININMNEHSEEDCSILIIDNIFRD